LEAKLLLLIIFAEMSFAKEAVYIIPKWFIYRKKHQDDAP